MAEETEALISTLRGLTIRLGDPSLEYVLGGEGNTSVKLDNGKRMVIKASGTTFLNPEFVAVDVVQALQLVSRKYNSIEVAERMKKMVVGSGQPLRRPSKEVTFHSFLRHYKWIVHTHPREIEGFVCSKAVSDPVRRATYIKKLEELTESTIAFVPYAGLGITLARAVKVAVDRHMKEKRHSPDVIFLQNHGIIVGGNEPKVTEAATGKYVTAVAVLRMELEKHIPSELLRFGGCKSGYIEDREKRLGTVEDKLKVLGFTNVSSSSSGMILDLVCSRKGKSYVLQGNIAPEQIQYLGLRPVWVSHVVDIKEQIQALGRAVQDQKARLSVEPKAIYIEGLGVVAIGKSATEVKLALSIAEKSVDVLGRTLAFGGPKYLTKLQEKAVLAE